MLAHKTSSRPADLPDFKSPPVTEVVLGVQFNTVGRFLSPHLGLVWDRFRSTFPNIEEHPTIPPIFETFGPNPQFFPGVAFQVSTGAEMPRIFFMNSNRTQLLQVQRDRFLHNWRKVGTGDDYPRFEHMLDTFADGFQTFTRVLSDQGMGSVAPNQCEVTYINQIPAQENESHFEIFNRLFRQQAVGTTFDDLGAPEDMRFLIRYVMRDADRAPIGRLIVSAEPARRNDGVGIIQLTLTAMGKPHAADMDGVIDFLQQGRLHIVRGFTSITSDTMHNIWERIR